MRRLRLGWVATLATLLFLGGCKQGFGERCQIDNDCESGLVCSESGVCSRVRGMQTPDAPLPPPVDAGEDVVDAPAADGATTPDAAPTPDAL